MTIEEAVLQISFSHLIKPAAYGEVHLELLSDE
jgi:hypothetical protein